MHSDTYVKSVYIQSVREIPRWRGTQDFSSSGAAVSTHDRPARRRAVPLRWIARASLLVCTTALRRGGRAGGPTPRKRCTYMCSVTSSNSNDVTRWGTRARVNNRRRGPPPSVCTLCVRVVYSYYYNIRYVMYKGRARTTWTRRTEKSYSCRKTM